MGDVYKAEDSKLHRQVALKLLASHLLRDDEARKRFHREAQAAASLSHPNVTIYEIDEAEDKTFLALEYVEGETLEQRIEKGPVSLQDALEIARQIAEGLQAAHAKGVVHRDVKTGNILITPDGRVKILDFGLALLIEGSKLTQLDTTVGTVAYMSTEQAQGAEVDHRTDIWALGCVLYEMICGQRPFKGQYDQALLYEIVNEEPEPLTGLRTGIPVELEVLVGKALAKTAAERYQSTGEIALDIKILHKKLDSGRTVAVSKPAVDPAALTNPVSGNLVPRRKLQVAWALFAVAALIAVGVSALHFMVPGSGDGPGWTIAPLTSYIGTERDPAIESDPGWSPDGRRIAFIRKDGIFMLPALGGQERQIATLKNALRVSRTSSSGLSWSPDGRFVAVGTLDGIRSINVESGESRPLTQVLPPTFDRFPRFSPDGNSIAFYRGSSIFSGAAYVLSLSGDGLGNGEPSRITEPAWRSDGLDWLDEGRTLVFSGRMGSRFLLWKLRTAGASPELLPVDSDGVLQPSVSTRARRLVYRRDSREVNIWQFEGPGPSGRPAEGYAPQPFVRIGSTQEDRNPQFSPDGRQVSFISTRTGFSEVWRAGRDGTGQIQLTDLKQQVSYILSARWSPDGQWLVFDAYSEGNSDIYRVSSEGEAPAGSPPILRLTAHQTTRTITSGSTSRASVAASPKFGKCLREAVKRSS